MVAANAALASYTPDKDSRGHGLTLTNKHTTGTVTSYGDPHVPIAFANVHNMEKLKQEKGKGGSSSNPIAAIPINIVPKKKVKKKPQVNPVEAQFHFDKVAASSDERYKQQKHAAVPVMKPALQPGPDNRL